MTLENVHGEPQVVVKDFLKQQTTKQCGLSLWTSRNSMGHGGDIHQPFSTSDVRTRCCVLEMVNAEALSCPS